MPDQRPAYHPDRIERGGQVYANNAVPPPVQQSVPTPPPPPPRTESGT